MQTANNSGMNIYQLYHVTHKNCSQHNVHYTVHTRDCTGTVSGTVPAWNNDGSVRSQNIFCSAAGTC